MSKSERWYAAGLHFECTECGECCSGPGEGVIWITQPEIRMLAEHLGVDEEELRQKYLRREGNRTTIVEDPETRDCIFLKQEDGLKKCSIYAVRPNQCRTWPFWSENLQTPDTWRDAARHCPGINRGPCHDFVTIEKIRKQKHWWEDEDE